MIGLNISSQKVCAEEKKSEVVIMMKKPFPKSESFVNKYNRLLEVVDSSDTLGILINADPDSMASAMALKRIFWKKARRVVVYRINSIKRADNLAFVKFLSVEQKHIRYLKRSTIKKWALVDSQPQHHKLFMKQEYDIIIDHHPATDQLQANFLDIREGYGANSSIMTEYLKAGKIKPSPRLATALFYGIKTDTHNFIRVSIPHDMDAFKYLYKFTNFRILRKIESSEMTRGMLSKYRQAMENLIFIRDIAFVHMERVDNPDLLVQIADFFMKIAEIQWSIVSGVYKDNLVVILRNASFQNDAGKTASKVFGRWKGSAGGHRNAARAEIPLENILDDPEDESGLAHFVKKNLKSMK
jgi:nanoRNase/pAp phosphatase (c-di-AMP/oligoRNAs hydrolase)